MVAAVPGTPCIPWGMPKLKTAADDVPELVTVAAEPGANVDVAPAVIVAAVPVEPLGPGNPDDKLTVAGDGVETGIVADWLKVRISPMLDWSRIGFR